MGQIENTKLIAPGKWYTEHDEYGIPVKAVYDKSYREVLGYESEEEFADAQKKWETRIHPDDAERVEMHFQDVIAKHPEGMDYDIEYRIMTRMGYRWFHDYGRCTRREDGSLKRCDGVMFDIQEIKDFELQQAHESLQKEILDYIVSHDDDDPIELLGQFAEKIRTILDCDQVIYRDLEDTRIMVNSSGIEQRWSVPESYCRQCKHFDAHHPMYKDGYTEMDNCQKGWRGIPVYEKCPIKSSLTRIVYCNGEVAGYLAIHYVQKYHQFTDIERKTSEVFVRNLSLALSKYETKKRLQKIQEQKEDKARKIAENYASVLALEDNLESLYDVELESGKYVGYVKGDFYQTNVVDKLLPQGDYFEDLRGNIDAVIYPDDRDGLCNFLQRESLRNALSETDRAEYFYRISLGDTPVWFKIRIVYKDAYRKNVIIGVFNASQELEAKQIEEQRAQIAEQATFTNFFLETYVSAYYVNLDTLACKTYKRTAQLENDYPIITNYFDSIQEYIAKDVHPDDREDLLECVDPERMSEILRNQLEYTHVFRDISGGKEKTYRMQVIRGGEASHAAFGFLDITDEINEQNKRLKEADETRKLVDNLATEYHAAFIVDMEDDSFRLLRMDDEIIGSKEHFRDFTEAKNFFIENVCHPTDKAMMAQELDYDHIREHLTSRRAYDVEYRALIYGTTVWFKMNITSISGNHVAIGFVKKDLDIVRRRLEEKKFNEYIALYVVDIDTSMIKPFKIASDDIIVEDRPAVPFEETMEMFVSKFEGEAHEFFSKISDVGYIKKEFALDDKRSFACRTPQGRWVDFSCYIISRHDDGTPSMSVFGYSDSDALSSERNEMQQKLEDALQLAQAASMAKSNFLFNMSHDIRTPMNAITGFTTIAKKNAGNKDIVLDYLNKIDVSGQQLLMLINQVLEMARIESGKVEFDEHPVNIKERFDVMVTVLSEQAQVHGLTFNSSMRDIEHYNVFADDARMGQVTLNIVGNAMKYTPEGGNIEFSIREIPARKEGCGTYVFTVQDTGIGMSEEYLKNLYEPFSREKSSTVSKIQGTGLGLSIVKSLIDLAGGQIDVQSELGKGTRFDITMDFKLNDTAPEPEMPASEPSSFNFKGKRTLLVEDNELNREIATYILGDKGVVVDDADDGDVAVRKVEEMVENGNFGYYDFILMDVQMPRMNGYEATNRIRRILDPLGVHIPIIALSANAFEEDRLKSIEAGMDDHVAKPIDIDVLMTTLVKYL